MDVLWFRLSRRAVEPEMLDLRLVPGRFAALIDRRDYWQIAWVIPKGEFDNVRAAGLDAFRQTISSTIPELANRVDELRDWDQIKLLTVRADRLARWYRAGYLAIGDAAHAMSPIAGVGINIAIQDAVEAANVLWRPLRTNTLSVRDLKRVQARRELSVRLMQAFQGVLQNRVVMTTLRHNETVELPRLFQWLLRTPIVQDIPARVIGFGIVRPHVRAPQLVAQRSAAATSRPRQLASAR